MSLGPAVNEDGLLLPQGTRLLHIGPPKTGTTTLQWAAAQARSTMYQHDAYYPGRRVNHRREVYAFMGRPDTRAKTVPQGGAYPASRHVPPMAEWDTLMADVGSEPSRRILISYEAMARASTKMARRFVHKVGPDKAHVAITLRAPAALIPGRWTESLKSGLSDTFDDWLRRVYAADEVGKKISKPMRRYLDQGALVSRWARAVGPDNVTVVVVDKSNKELLTEAFEKLLGLPQETLADAADDGVANRSLSMPEAELLRRTNLNCRGIGIPRHLYYELVYRGAVQRLMLQRKPEANEPRVRMPQWASDQAVADGKCYAQRIADSGVRVVGDLETLYRPPSTAEDESPATETDYLLDIADETLAGAVLAAADQVETLRQAKSREKAEDTFSTRALMRAVARRIGYKVRTGRSKPLAGVTRSA